MNKSSERRKKLKRKGSDLRLKQQLKLKESVLNRKLLKRQGKKRKDEKLRRLKLREERPRRKRKKKCDWRLRPKKKNLD